MKKLFLISLLFVFTSSHAYELEYSRTYNKIAAQNNKLTFQINSEGHTKLSLPTFSTKKSVFEETMRMDDKWSVEDLISQVVQKKVNNLDRKLALIKSKNPTKRFYSSEVDQFELLIKQENTTLLHIKFNNWQELNHYYNSLGEWQPLVDLIKNLQKEIINQKQSLKKRGES